MKNMTPAGRGSQNFLTKQINHALFSTTQLVYLIQLITPSVPIYLSIYTFKTDLMIVFQIYLHNFNFQGLTYLKLG